MKKVLLMSSVFLLTFFLCPTVHAGNSLGTGRYIYNDLGGIYTNTTFPVDTAQVQAEEGKGKDVDLSKLRRGEAKSTNILLLVDVGDSGIDAAMKNGGITKPLYVDTEIHKLFIPLGFIPLYVKETKTIVYGE